MKQISGGVCAAKGYKAAGVSCGIRKKNKKDLALIVSEKKAAAACVYTLNLVKGAPIAVTKANVADGWAQAVICNSGNANTCNADGLEIAAQTAALTAQALGIAAEDVLVASTGVIGLPLSIEPFETGVPQAAAALSRDGCDAAAEGIMTTETIKKEVAVEFC